MNRNSGRGRRDNVNVRDLQPRSERVSDDLKASILSFINTFNSTGHASATKIPKELDNAFIHSLENYYTHSEMRLFVNGVIDENLFGLSMAEDVLNKTFDMFIDLLEPAGTAAAYRVQTLIMYDEKVEHTRGHGEN